MLFVHSFNIGSLTFFYVTKKCNFFPFAIWFFAITFASVCKCIYRLFFENTLRVKLEYLFLLKYDILISSYFFTSAVLGSNPNPSLTFDSLSSYVQVKNLIFVPKWSRKLFNFHLFSSKSKKKGWKVLKKKIDKNVQITNLFIQILLNRFKTDVLVSQTKVFKEIVTKRCTVNSGHKEPLGTAKKVLY